MGWFSKSLEKVAKEEKKPSRQYLSTLINHVLIAIAVVYFIYAIGSIVDTKTAYLEIEDTILFCKEGKEGDHARVAVYNEGLPKNVEVTVKGIGETIEVHTSRVYVGSGETKYVNILFSIKVNRCTSQIEILD